MLRKATAAAEGLLSESNADAFNRERAFALAETGSFAGVGEIREQLQAEGFASSQLYGRSLAKQIRAICQRAQQRQRTSPRNAATPRTEDTKLP